MRPQVAQNLVECGIQVSGAVLDKRFAPRMFCQGDQGVLPAPVASGIAPDRQHDQRVYRNLGGMGRAQRVVKLETASGIAAIGNDDDDRAAVALLQILGRQQNRVINRRAGLWPDPPQSGSKLLLVASEIGEDRDVGGKGKDGSGIARLRTGPQQSLQEAAGRLPLVTQLHRRAQACIH